MYINYVINDIPTIAHNSSLIEESYFILFLLLLVIVLILISFEDILRHLNIQISFLRLIKFK